MLSEKIFISSEYIDVASKILLNNGYDYEISSNNGIVVHICDVDDAVNLLLLNGIDACKDC